MSAAIVFMSVANYLKCTLSNNSCPQWPGCQHGSRIRIAGSINRTIMIMNHCQTHLWWPTFHPWCWSVNHHHLFSPTCFVDVLFSVLLFELPKLWTHDAQIYGCFSPFCACRLSEPSDFWRQFVSRSYWSLCICCCSVGILWRPVSHGKKDRDGNNCLDNWVIAIL